MDWTGINQGNVRSPLLKFVQDVYAMRVKGEVEYALSIRDIAQFLNHYRSNFTSVHNDMDSSRTDQEELKNSVKNVPMKLVSHMKNQGMI